MTTVTTYHAVVGKRRHLVRSWKQVSEAFVGAIESLGLGASQTPQCRIVDVDGNVVAHVSYNGRVWKGDGKLSGICLYDPRQG